MALKTKENVQPPKLGPGQQPDNQEPFKGGTRGGRGQTDPSSVRNGAAGGKTDGSRNN